LHIHTFTPSFLHSCVRALLAPLKRFIVRQCNQRLLLELAQHVQQRLNDVRALVAAAAATPVNDRSFAFAGDCAHACSIASATDIDMRALVHELVSNLFSVLSPRRPRSSSSSPVASFSFQTDPRPPSPLRLPVLVAPYGGIDRYDPSISDFAGKCLGQLMERGALVLDCGLNTSLPACLHRASQALLRQALTKHIYCYCCINHHRCLVADFPQPRLFFSFAHRYFEVDAAESISCRQYLVQTSRWPPTYATCNLLSFHTHVARIVFQIESLLCAANTKQSALPLACGDAVAVHHHSGQPQNSRSSGSARMRSMLAPARWLVMLARGDGLAIRREGISSYVDFATPCEDHLVIVPGQLCPVERLRGGAAVRCRWSHGSSDWSALHLHLGLEQEQHAAQCALLESLGGSCLVGARMNGKWTWQDKCSEN
jgi:hypothetical protein